MHFFICHPLDGQDKKRSWRYFPSNLQPPNLQPAVYLPMTRFVAAILILAVIAFATFSLFQKTEQTHSVKVNLPAIKAMGYFADTNRLNEWMIPYQPSDAWNNGKLTHGADTLVIDRLGAIEMEFTRSNARSKQEFKILVLPDKDSMFQSHFLLQYHVPRWKKIFSSPILTQTIASLDSLKSFLDNPASLYGFDIKNEQVADTSFLFAKKTIAKKDFAMETRNLFDMLIKEAEKRNAGYTGVRIFHFLDHGNERTIFASIGIRNNVETPEGDVVSLKKMPFQLNLLTIDYQGPYSGVAKAYQALENYRQDYRYVTMAIPFHKYLQDGYGFDDSTVVHMKVCYPVF